MPWEPSLCRRRRSARRRPVLLAVGMALVLIVGACSSAGGAGRSLAPSTSTSTSTSTTNTTTTVRPLTSTTSEPAPSSLGPNTAMAVRVIPPHQARYHDGKLYLEGALPNRRIADQFKQKAIEVIGAANVIDRYVIDPVAPTPTDGRVVVDEPLLFPTGSAELDPRYYPIANLGVTVMKLNPQVVMRIYGYTDEVGTHMENRLLSLARANAVADYISARGISRSRFHIVGRGETHPVASNRTAEGRRRNRRIEVDLLHLLG